jgi:excisionase family DNA binding protein
VSDGAPSSPKRFLTRVEVAEELNISEAQVYALLRRGELRAMRVGGRKTYRVSRADVETFIEYAYRDTEQWIREHPFEEGQDSGRDPDQDRE